MLALAAAVPLTIFRQGSARAWWFGFAFFGWLYLLLLAYSWSLDPNTSQSNPLRPYSLATAQLSSSGYHRIYAGAAGAAYYAPATIYNYQPGPTPIALDFAIPVTNVNGTITNATLVPANVTGNPQAVAPLTNTPGAFSFYVGTNGAASTFTGPSHDDFVNVAHAFWALLLALCGGWFTGWIYKRPVTQQESKTDSAESSDDA
jgi:hypothetical protein